MGVTSCSTGMQLPRGASRTPVPLRRVNAYCDSALSGVFTGLTLYQGISKSTHKARRATQLVPWQDVAWASCRSCIHGWDLQGIWPQGRTGAAPSGVRCDCPIAASNLCVGSICKVTVASNQGWCMCVTSLSSCDQWCCRSGIHIKACTVSGDEKLAVTIDSDGLVKVFDYPCIRC